jgi:hypothetical protein
VSALGEISPPVFIFAFFSDTPSGQTWPFRLCPYTTDYYTPEDAAATPIQAAHEEPVYIFGGTGDCKDVCPVSRYERQ